MDPNTTLKPGNRLLTTLVNMKFRLKVGISHLSISRTVVKGRRYISHSFYFSIIFYMSASFVIVCWLIFVFVFGSMTLDSTLSNQESILTCLLSF